MRVQKSKEMRPARISKAEGLRLAEGKVYIFTECDEADAKKRIKKRMRLIKCYRHHAVFESEKGIRRSYQYWDIEKMLLKGTMKYDEH